MLILLTTHLCMHKCTYAYGYIYLHRCIQQKIGSTVTQTSYNHQKTAQPQRSLYGFTLKWTLLLSSTVVRQNWWPSAVQNWRKRSLTAKLTLSPDQVEINVNLWNDFKITLKSLPPHRYDMKTILYEEQASGWHYVSVSKHTETDLLSILQV